jgi:hypothetical protein
VERAADALALHLAAHAEVRAEVRAVRVDHARLARFGTEEHDVTAEHVQRHRLTRVEVAALRDHEPAVGHGEGEPLLPRLLRAHDRPARPVAQRLAVPRHREAGEGLVLDGRHAPLLSLDSERAST